MFKHFYELCSIVASSMLSAEVKFMIFSQLSEILEYVESYNTGICKRLIRNCRLICVDYQNGKRF